MTTTLRGMKDCYKIKLQSAGYRLVYQVRDLEIVVSVVAVGKRDRNQVYKVALSRLWSCSFFSLLLCWNFGACYHWYRGTAKGLSLFMLYLIRAGVNLRLFATHNMNKRCGHNSLIFQTYLIWAWILGVWEVQLIGHSAGNKKPLSSSVTEVASPIGAVLPGTVVPAVSLVNKIVLACVHSNHCLSLTSCFYLP